MNEFELILEECVDLIASGEASLDECLSEYPEYAALLEPILCTAMQLREGREEGTPPPFLRSRIRAKLDRAMKDNPPKDQPKDDQSEADPARIMTVIKSPQDALHKLELSLPALDTYFSAGGASQTSSP